MSAPWFYMQQLPRQNEQAMLDAREARHATGARRLAVGDELCLFDGSGTVAGATIADVSPREVALTVHTLNQQEAPEPRIHLAVALPKGDRQSVLLSMAMQLGISAVTPLVCDRSVVRPGQSFRERAMRIFIESCKQSHRAHLPTMHEPATVAQVVASASEGGAMIVFAHPEGRSAKDMEISTRSGRSVTILVGPEGGFTEAEVQVARDAGAEVVTLGQAILRIETAAVALLAIIKHA